MKSKGLVLSCFLFFTTAICAGEATNSQRGAGGLSSFTISVSNSGRTPLDCQVTTAHWYSVELGSVAPGKALSAALWKDLHSGEVFILNTREDRMPVQRIWCGAAGRSWRTRSEMPLPTRIGERPRPVTLACAAGDGAVSCRPA